MNRKIPTNAFDIYFGLGPGRSYRAVAERCGVSKQAITKLAKRDGWQGRLQDIEDRSRQDSTQKAVDTVAEMNARHLKMLKAVQGKALETLRSMPLATAMDAVRSLEMTIKHERVICGEPTERAALTVEEVTERELRRWLIAQPAAVEGSDE